MSRALFPPFILHTSPSSRSLLDHVLPNRALGSGGGGCLLVIILLIIIIKNRRRGPNHVFRRSKPFKWRSHSTFNVPLPPPTTQRSFGFSTLARAMLISQPRQIGATRKSINCPKTTFMTKKSLCVLLVIKCGSSVTVAAFHWPHSLD